MEPRRHPGSFTALRHVFALSVFSGLALFFTYPLVFNLGEVNGSGDPAVMVWSMAWIQHATLSGSFATFFDANIFHPTTDSLAYTDLLLPNAIATLPLYVVTNNPLVSFNVALISTYVLSGYAVFLLAARLLRDRSHAFPAAIFAGVVYELCPYRTGHITQLNTMTTYFLPLILLFLHRYMEDGRKPGDALAIGLLFTLNALSGLYYGIFAALMISAFYLLYSLVNRRSPEKEDFLYGGPAALFSVAILAVILSPYLRLSDDGDHDRSVETAEGGAVIAEALLTSPPESALLGWTPEALNTTNEDGRPMYELTLYPGIAATALAVFGLIANREHGALRRRAALYGLLALVIFVFSLGPFVNVGGVQLRLPYFYLYEYVPGFGSLRVPARMWAIVMVCLAVLAAFGLRALLERLDRKLMYSVALVLVFAVTLTEYLPTLPVERHTDPGEVGLAPAYEYLAENADERTVVAEVPFASPVDAFRETPRMYRSTYGWWRLVNGYASYFPDGYEETRAALDTVSTPASLAKMRELDVDYLVVHPEEYEDEGMNAESIIRSADETPELERVIGDEDAVLYRFDWAR